MSTKSLAYDHPAYLARNSSQVVCPAVAASASAAKFLAFSAIRVKSIKGLTVVAGTAAGAGYDIYNGTSSVGAITVGTQVAGAATPALTQDIVLAAGGYIDFKTKADSATAATAFVVEHELISGASITA